VQQGLPLKIDNLLQHSAVEAVRFQHLAVDARLSAVLTNWLVMLLCILPGHASMRDLLDHFCPF
jgi:hypothetical protein